MHDILRLVYLDNNSVPFYYFYYLYFSWRKREVISGWEEGVDTREPGVTGGQD